MFQLRHWSGPGNVCVIDALWCILSMLYVNGKEQEKKEITDLEKSCNA